MNANMKSLFVQSYIEIVENMSNAMNDNDYKLNNKYAIKMNKLINQYKESDFIKAAMNELLENKNPEVKLVAASDSFRLKILIDKSEQVLENITIEYKGNFLGFRAENCLKLWKNQGYLD